MTPFPRWLICTKSGIPGLEIRFWRMREVDTNLYVGGFCSPDFGVPFDWDHIFDLCGSSDQHGDEYHFPFTALPFEDGDPVPVSTLEAVWEKVRETSGPVLIHCAEGLSRSASVAYAVMRRRGLSHVEAHSRIVVPEHEAYPMPVTLQSAREWAETSGTLALGESALCSR